MTYAETFVLALGTSQTALSLKAALVETDGTIHETRRDLTSGFTEHGAGQYQWRYADFPDGFEGTVVFYTGALDGAENFAAVTVKASAVAGLAVAVASSIGSLQATELANAIVAALASADGVPAIIVPGTVDAGTASPFVRGTTWQFQIVALQGLLDWTHLVWTLRKNRDAADADSIAQIQLTAAGDESDGLTVFAGKTAEDAAAGKLTVAERVITVDEEDVTVYDVTATIEADTTAAAPIGDLHWDLKAFFPPADPDRPPGVSQPTYGRGSVIRDVTRRAA